jgi:hypothetical protein
VFADLIKQGKRVDLGRRTEPVAVVQQVERDLRRKDEIGGRRVGGDVARSRRGRQRLQQVGLAGAGIAPQVGEMLARCTLRELVHQVRQFGIFPDLEGIEAVRRLGA